MFASLALFAAAQQSSSSSVLVQTIPALIAGTIPATITVPSVATNPGFVPGTVPSTTIVTVPSTAANATGPGVVPSTASVVVPASVAGTVPALVNSPSTTTVPGTVPGNIPATQVVTPNTPLAPISSSVCFIRGRPNVTLGPLTTCNTNGVASAFGSFSSAGCCATSTGFGRSARHLAQVPAPNPSNGAIGGTFLVVTSANQVSQEAALAQAISLQAAVATALGVPISQVPIVFASGNGFNNGTTNNNRNGSRKGLLGLLGLLGLIPLCLCLLLCCLCCMRRRKRMADVQFATFAGNQHVDLPPAGPVFAPSHFPSAAPLGAPYGGSVMAGPPVFSP